jgi:hypothetical protein
MLADAAEAHSLERPTPGSKEPMLPEIPQAPQMMADVTDDSECLLDPLTRVMRVGHDRLQRSIAMAPTAGHEIASLFALGIERRARLWRANRNLHLAEKVRFQQLTH